MINFNNNNNNNINNIVANYEDLDSFNLLDNDAAPGAKNVNNINSINDNFNYDAAPEVNVNNINNNYDAAPKSPMNNINNNEANEFSIFNDGENLNYGEDLTPNINKQEEMNKKITELEKNYFELKNKVIKQNEKIKKLVAEDELSSFYYNNQFKIRGLEDKKRGDYNLNLKKSFEILKTKKEKYLKEYDEKYNYYNQKFNSLEAKNKLRVFMTFFSDKLNQEFDTLKIIEELIGSLEEFFNSDYREEIDEYLKEIAYNAIELENIYDLNELNMF